MNRALILFRNPWICLAARLYLGAIFVAACLHKIANPGSFAVDIATYQFLPPWSVNAFAIVLPWVEALAGAMLIAGYRVRAAALLIVGMMVSFMIALTWALSNDIAMSCGCFASTAAEYDDPISWETLLRDGIWLALGVYVLLFDVSPLGVERLIKKWRRSDARQV